MGMGIQSGASFCDFARNCAAWPPRRRAMRFVLLVVALVFVGVPEVHAYRTTADVEGFDGQAATWADPASVSIGAADPVLHAAVAAAAQVWMVDCWSGPRLDQDSPDIVVRFVDDWSTTGLPVAQAATTEVDYERVGGEWRIRHAEILLNATGGNALNVSREIVLAHELGHAFGLLHVCASRAAPEEDEGIPPAPSCIEDYAASIMHPVYSESRSRPNRDDYEGICALAASSTRPPATGALGDLCNGGHECTSAVCSSRGVCSTPCRAGICDQANSSCVGGVCELLSRGFGETCDRGEDCVSGLCLSDEETDRCTRRCDSGCPVGYACTAVDNQAICSRVRSGCAFASGTGGTSPWLCLIGLAWLVLRRRSRANLNLGN